MELIQVEENHYVINSANIKELFIIIAFIIISCGVLEFEQFNGKNSNSSSFMPIIILGIIPFNKEEIILEISIFNYAKSTYATIGCSTCGGKTTGLLDKRKEGIIRCICNSSYFVHVENPHKVILTKIKRN